MTTAGPAPPIRTDLGPVTVWSSPSLGKYPDGNQLIVRGRDSIAVLDTPLVSLELNQELECCDLMILGHVHEDHMVGIGRLADRPLYVHEADVAAARSWDGLARHYGYDAQALEPLRLKVFGEFCWQERSDALAYRDGMRWDLGDVSIQAIHMPGHTAGHCVLLIEPGGIAFIGDIDLSGFGPYYGDACSSLRDFRLTLARMAALPAKVWITSHHKGIVRSKEAFMEQLQGFAARIETRSERIVSLLSGQPGSLNDLVSAGVMYRPGTASEGWMRCAERRCIEQHLVELLDQGRVREVLPGQFQSLA